MTLTKRVLALALALCMVLCLLPAPAFAENADGVAATEVAGLNRLEEALDRAEPQAAGEYAPDEPVTVIVRMEEPAVMEYYGMSAYAMDGTLTAGKAVSEFLASDDARALSTDLLAGQLQVLTNLAQTQPAAAALAAEDSGFEVLAQWTNVINGMAVRLPYCQLETLRRIPGVLDARVQQVYSLPEAPETQAGSAGYSYDMAGIQQVWDAGYTGAGLLVAVLDTGLDLEYATYWDGEQGTNVTGIRRVHEAFTADSFKTDAGKENVRWTETSLEWFLENNQLVVNTNLDGSHMSFEGNPMYKNRKVPFAVDYADGDMNVYSSNADHGTHVSGTVTGYVESEEGQVLFSGIAPDAQLLSMKVFTDSEGTAPEMAILSAMEDAAALGADVVNLSLGSNNGYSEDDSATGEAYARLHEAGVLFMTSAGNSGYSSYNSNYGDFALAADPEISMLSAPAAYGSNLAIASVNSSVTSSTYMTWTDADGAAHDIEYLDSTGVAWKYMFAGEEDLAVNIIPVDGYGTYNDYYNAGFRGYYGYGEKGVTGIALVKRGGGLSFVEKINAATQFTWSYYNSAVGSYVTEHPVKAVLIYDEDPTATELLYMSTEGAAMTACFISGVDGAALYEAATAAMEAGTYAQLTNVESMDRISSWDEAGLMSEFSSWGAGPGLELKPEITAPGGNIWSSILDTGYSGGSGTYSDYTGSYGMNSGTSMSAPHVTGIAALVKQYLMDAHGMTRSQAAALVEKLMVSTAQPLKDANGIYYSPRQQGAGLIDAAAAITTPAYISVDGGIGKLELKDDPEKTGEYTLCFTVHNFSDASVTYDIYATLLRPDTATVESPWGERTVMTASDVVLGEYSLNSVTVAPGAEVTVTDTVVLTQEQKQELDSLFENGTYVEGFITLVNDTDPQLGLPVLAFYGDWTSAPIFDRADWLDEPADGVSFKNNETTWNPSVMGYYDGYAFYNLGQNPFDSFAADNQVYYHEENITISPKGLFRSINDVELYQLREAKVVVVEVKDKNTGEVYYRDWATYQPKGYFDQNYGMALPSSVWYFTSTAFEGKDMEGNVLPNGTQCVMSITAYGDGDYTTVYDENAGYTVIDYEGVIPGENEPTFNGHAMDMTGDVLSFDVLVDTEAPKLINSAVSVYEEDGRVYMTGTFRDGVGSIASVEIIPQVKRSYNMANYPYGDPEYFEYGLDEINPFFSEVIYDADTHEYTFLADVTEYAHTNESYAGENNYYQYEWTGNVFIFGGDYGGNDRAYAVTVDTGDGLILSHTSAQLHVGDTFELSVIDNTGSGLPIVRTSDDETVATIDEYGNVVAVGAGQAVITVTNGEDSAICIVVVEEYPTEVLDFDLSIDHFSGLTPDGSITVQVINLQPADVVLEEVRWTIYEDDPEWAGLATISKDSRTGLSGRITLSANTDDSDYDSAGSGYLDVTLNGVTRTMTFDWNELYDSATADGLISDAYYTDQTVYVNAGETATLIARYRQNHSFIPVELYTLEGYTAYSSTNPTTPGVGLVLDGPTFATNGAEWRGKLVAQEGYTLPESIKVCTRYDYGYESEMQLNSYYGGYTYDASTGEIVVKQAPYGATNTLVIRADGVVTEGAPAGEHSGITYTRPEATYGPFDWAVTEGYDLTGELTTAEGVTLNGTVKNVAYYTPSEPGVSYITATTADGSSSVNFAVVCLPGYAESLSVDTHGVELEVGQTAQLTATLEPMPSLQEHEQLIWTSFDESVATVDGNGLITAVAPGYAYIKVCTAIDTTVMDYCIVHVKAPVTHTVTFLAEGEVIDVQTVVEGQAAVAPEAPEFEGKTFVQWDTDFSCVTADLTVNAVYRTNTYTVTFVADGVVVETVTVEHGTVLSEEDYPAVPEKEGFTGAWQTVTEPVTGALVIEAVYTAIETEPTEPSEPTEPEESEPTEPEESEPSEPETSKPAGDDDSADTGDGFHAAWLLAMVFALAGAAVLMLQRKRV